MLITLILSDFTINGLWLRSLCDFLLKVRINWSTDFWILYKNKEIFHRKYEKPSFCEQFYDQVEVISVVVSLYFDKNERRIRSIKRFDHQQISNPIYFNYNICKIYISCKNFNFGHIDTHHSDGIWKGKILGPRCTYFEWPAINDL